MEVATVLTPVDDIESVVTPAGEVAMTVHKEPYSGLGGAREAVIRWCNERGRARANVWWKIYGDWREDTAELHTEVFHSLSPDEP